MAATPSARLRERGNDWFRKAAAAKDSAQHGHLQVALSLFEGALDAAGNDEDAAAAHKNIAAALFHLAGCSGGEGDAGAASSSAAGGAPPARLDLLRRAAQHRCCAWAAGCEAGKTQSWTSAMWSSIQDSVDAFTQALCDWVADAPVRTSVALHQLELLHSALPDDEGVLVWRLHASMDVLAGIKALAARLIDPAAQHGPRASAGADPDWRGCMAVLAETHRPLCEALQLAVECSCPEDLEQLLQLEDAVFVMTCRCESSQARLQGDELLQRALKQRQDRLDRQQAQAQAQAHNDTSAQQDQGSDWHAVLGRRRRVRTKRRQGGAAPPPPTAAAAAPTAAPAASPAASPSNDAAQTAELEGILSAMDKYKAAALLARERDLQAEAQALSRLGHLYKVCATVLEPVLLPATGGGPGRASAAPAVGLARSPEERARDAFLRVLLLVDSLPHKMSCFMEGWYREARDAISAYQATTAAAEDAQREKERAPVREALADELRELYAAAGKGWVELLKFVYTQHPPTPTSRLAPDTVFSADTGKQLLKAAIVAYHPDKQAAQGAPTRWQVLAEEITKELTRKYEMFK